MTLSENMYILSHKTALITSMHRSVSLWHRRSSPESRANSSWKLPRPKRERPPRSFGISSPLSVILRHDVGSKFRISFTRWGTSAKTQSLLKKGEVWKRFRKGIGGDMFWDRRELFNFETDRIAIDCQAQNLKHDWSVLEVPFSEKFQTETKPIPMKWQLQKPNTKPIFILPKIQIFNQILTRAFSKYR